MAILALRCARQLRHHGIAAIEYTLLVGLLASCLVGALFVLGNVSESTAGVLPRDLAAQSAPPALAALLSEAGGNEQASANWPMSGRKLWLFSVGLAALGTSGLSWHKIRAGLCGRRDRRGDLLADFPRDVPRDRLFAKRHTILKVIEHDLCALLEGRLQVRHLMSIQPVIVAEDCPLAEIRQIMAERGVHHLMVCDADGVLQGVVSDRDLARGKGVCASDIMTREVVTVTPDTLISPAVTQLINRRISSLPVVDHGKPCGVLTTTDLVMALQCTLQAMLRFTGGGTRAGDRRGQGPAADERDLTADWSV